MSYEAAVLWSIARSLLAGGLCVWLARIVNAWRAAIHHGGTEARRGEGSNQLSAISRQPEERGGVSPMALALLTRSVSEGERGKTFSDVSTPMDLVFDPNQVPLGASRRLSETDAIKEPAASAWPLTSAKLSLPCPVTPPQNSLLRIAGRIVTIPIRSPVSI